MNYLGVEVREAVERYILKKEQNFLSSRIKEYNPKST